MGKINVVTNDGRVVALDESLVEHAKSLGVDPNEESAAGEQNRKDEAKRKETYGGALGQITSFSSGVADTATLGGFGKLVDAVGGGDIYRDVAEENPGSRELGEAGALLIPGMAEAGGAGQLGRGARYLGASENVARGIEGSAFGIGGAVAGSNVSGDPLTIESLVEGATIGGVLGYGTGVLADQLTQGAANASAEIEKTRQIESAQDMFEQPSPGYDNLVAARKGAVEAANDANSLVDRQTATMEKYKASTEDFIRDRNGFDKALDQVWEHVQPGYKGTLPTRWAPEVTPEAARQLVADGGRAVDQATALRNTDMEVALNKLRPLRDELARKFDIVIPDLPAIPGGKVPVPDALPKTLKEFSRMRPETVASVSNMLSQPEADALAQLIKEKDLIPNSTPNGTLADVHAVLSQHMNAIDELEKVGGASNSLLVHTLKWAARKGGRSALGGLLGGLTGVPGARMLGAAIGGYTAGDMVTAATLEARSVMRDRIRQVVSKFGGAAAKGAKSLGPVSAYLGESFVTGKSDNKGDLGDKAKRRIQEIMAATSTGADTTYAAVQPIIGIPGDVAPKVHAHINAALQHLTANAPKDAGMSPRGTGSSWKPSPTEALDLAYRIEALKHPLGAISRALSGEVHPAAIDSLHASWPGITGALAEEMQDRTDDTNELSPARQRGYSALLGNPMSGLDVPENVIALQGLYLPGASAARQPQPESSQSQPGAPGRPPKAGPSSVAGSNVSSLISQGQ